MLIFEADGRYGLILSRKDVPRFASNSRTNGTADENKAVVQGTISHFGRYTVNSADKSIVFHIELSTYPNFNGTEKKRSFDLVGDELKYTVPAFSGGGTAVARVRVASSGEGDFAQGRGEIPTFKELGHDAQPRLRAFRPRLSPASRKREITGSAN